jgi:hypothetical protein
MAARLTDKQKKKIIADYVQLGSYNAVAKINGVSDKTVKSVVMANPDFTEKSEQKKAENTADILLYMESQKRTICEIIGKGLNVLNDPEKLKEATPAQITTAIGTLIDKWTGVHGSNSNEQAASHNALIEAIRSRNHED